MSPKFSAGRLAAAGTAGAGARHRFRCRRRIVTSSPETVVLNGFVVVDGAPALRPLAPAAGGFGVATAGAAGDAAVVDGGAAAVDGAGGVVSGVAGVETGPALSGTLGGGTSAAVGGAASGCAAVCGALTVVAGRRNAMKASTPAPTISSAMSTPAVAS